MVHNIPMAKATISEFKHFLEEIEQYPFEFMENYSVITLKEDEMRVCIGLGDP